MKNKIKVEAIRTPANADQLSSKAEKLDLEFCGYMEDEKRNAVELWTRMDTLSTVARSTLLNERWIFPSAIEIDAAEIAHQMLAEWSLASKTIILYDELCDRSFYAESSVTLYITRALLNLLRSNQDIAVEISFIVGDIAFAVWCRGKRENKR